MDRLIAPVHHIGCLVSSLEEAVKDYQILYPAGTVSEIYDIEDQKVRVCFYTIGNIHIEFVEPHKVETALFRMLQKKPGFYHIGIFTADIDKETERLENEGYRKINKFRSVAFNNRYCVFMYNNEMHLIELIEAE